LDENGKVVFVIMEKVQEKFMLKVRCVTASPSVVRMLNKNNNYTVKVVPFINYEDIKTKKYMI
jgi:hypothetical protein